VKKRIVLLIVCVTIVAQVITIAAAVGSFRSSYQADIVASLKGYINAVKLGEQGVLEDVQAMADQYAQAYGQNIRITVIGSGGAVEADSQAEADSLENHSSRPEVRQALSEGFGTSVRTSESTGIETIYVASAIGDSVLRLSMPMENTMYFVNQALPVMIITFVVLTIIALVFAGALAKGVLAPMRELHESVQDYMDGEASEIKIDSKYEELEEISQAFTGLTNRLKRYINQVKLENKKSAIILDNIQEGLLVLDKDQDVLLINNAAREIFGAEDDITNVNLLHFTRKPEILRSIDKAFQVHKTTSFDVLDEQKGKTYRYYLSFVSPGTFAKSGDGMLVLIMDVTEAIRSERIRRDFAANVSHELKTPLTSINGYAQLLENGMLQDERDVPKYAHYITVEANRLMRLINDTLALSELENIAMDEGMEEVAVQDIARDVQSMLSQKLAEREITMTVDGAASMTANKNRIKQLLLNLCDNAIKYNRAGGTIDVIVSKKEEEVSITVKDTGIGIPEEEQSRIFERFYRAKNAGGATISGTGLGLAIVKHITQLYGGYITVQSIENLGSEITVHFTARTK